MALRNTYYGKYRGLVKDNKDPDERGRIRAVVPEIASDVLLDWALPCVPYGATISTNTENDTDLGTGGFGIFAIPELETGVWIEFESGDINRPIWVGTFFSTPATDGVPRDNVPWEAREKTNPDTEETDYPVEKVFKTERFRHVATRRIVIELDQDTSLTQPWETSEKTRYRVPKIEVGRRGVTDEDKVDGIDDKNIVDIATSSRDLRIDTERDRITASERDIHDRAGLNQTGTTPSTVNDHGDITHTAENQIEDIAYGLNAVNSDTNTPGEVFTHDAPNGKMRFSAGDIPQEDTLNTYEALHRSGDLTVKLTAETFLKLEASLQDILLKSGGTTYVRTGNGFLVETSSAVASGAGDSSANAAQLHYLNTGNPSDGSYVSHEVGKPSTDASGNTITESGSAFTGPSQTATSPRRIFLKLLDERAIKPYNEHWHRIDIPEYPEIPGGGTTPAPLEPGDEFWFEESDQYYSSVNSMGEHYAFENGLQSQVQYIAGTKEKEFDPYGLQMLGALGILGEVLEKLLGWLAQEFNDGAMESLFADINLKSLSVLDWGCGVDQVIDNSLIKFYNENSVLFAYRGVQGPNFSTEFTNGPLVKMLLKEYVPIGSGFTQDLGGPTDGGINSVSGVLNSSFPRNQDYRGIIKTGQYSGIGMISLDDRVYIGGGSTNPNPALANLISFPARNMGHGAFTDFNSAFAGPSTHPPAQNIYDPGSNSGGQQMMLTAQPPVVCQLPGFDYNAPLNPECFTVYSSNVVPEDRWAPEHADPRVSTSGLNNRATVSQQTTPHKVSTEYLQGN